MTPLTYTLRRAAWDDAEFVYQLRRTVYQEHVILTWGQWDEAWQRSYFFVKYDPAKARIIRVEGVPAGELELDCNADRLFLGNICLLPEHQNRGIGTAIIRRLIARAQRHGLHLELQVLKVNAAARRLYERLGLAVTSTNETHHMMRLTHQGVGQCPIGSSS